MNREGLRQRAAQARQAVTEFMQSDGFRVYSICVLEDMLDTARETGRPVEFHGCSWTALELATMLTILRDPDTEVTVDIPQPS